MHRIGRAGRFNTGGMVINFVCNIGDEEQRDVRKSDILIMKEI
jgi:superfamily II DNA/RNA helicase